MGGSAPSADPRIGQAAMLSSSTGRDMLSWMREQARVTNGWASEDRARYERLFQPMEERMVREASSFDSEAKKNEAARLAVADVRQQSAIEDATTNRQMMAVGVAPNSKRFGADRSRTSISQALAAAGAGNMARRNVTAGGEQRLAGIVNLGRGMAVNPATSIGLSNGAMAQGGNAAMAGYGQQGGLLNTQYQQQMQAWEAKQGQLGAIGGAAGSLLGFFSSKTVKHGKEDVDALGAVRKMPVQKWTYNPGVADESTHIGPYAEDFAKATGVGDGTKIDPISAIGVTMGAIRQLADKVDKLAEGGKPLGARRAAA